MNEVLHASRMSQASCKICNCLIEYRFRAQGLRETVNSVFKIELNFDGNVCCPSCLLYLELCRTMFLDKLPPGNKAKRGCCMACDEKMRTSTAYTVVGFPVRIMSLPYFARLKDLGSKCRLCVKCVATLEFAKKLAQMVELNSVGAIPAPSTSPPKVVSVSSSKSPEAVQMPPSKLISPPKVISVVPAVVSPQQPPPVLKRILIMNATTPPKIIKPTTATAIIPTTSNNALPPQNNNATTATETIPNTYQLPSNLTIRRLPPGIKILQFSAIQKATTASVASPSAQPQTITSPAPRPTTIISNEQPTLINLPPPPTLVPPRIPPLRVVLPPGNNLHPEIKLPKGVTWAQLTCYVDISRLETMRVPPIRIRDLKLQSILKTNSPDRTSKRVSFDNMAPRVISFSRAEEEGVPENTSTTATSQSEDSEEDVPLAVKFKAKRTDALPIAKRPRRASCAQISYEEPIYPISDTEGSDGDMPVNKSSHGPPPSKKFKVFRPNNNNNNNNNDKEIKKKEANKKSTASAMRLNTSLPSVPTTTLPMVTFPGTSSSASKEAANTLSNVNDSTNASNPVRETAKSKKATLVRNLFSGIAITSESRANNGMQAQSESSPGKAPQPRGSVILPSPSRSPGKSPNRRSARRSSVDSEVVLVAPQQQQPMTSTSEAAGKISNRRKTMDPTQSEQRYGMLRVVSIDKLRAPTPQIDLLLANVRSSNPNVLPRPFTFSPQ